MQQIVFSKFVEGLQQEGLCGQVEQGVAIVGFLQQLQYGAVATATILEAGEVEAEGAFAVLSLQGVPVLVDEVVDPIQFPALQACCGDVVVSEAGQDALF